MKLRAYAKINLALDVCGRLENGYHAVRMVMQSVSLCDVVTMRCASNGIVLSCSDQSLPCDGENLAFRAAAIFLERTGIHGGVVIELEKHIPMQAGLGGGSADAAAVLRGMDMLYETHLPMDTLLEWGLELGADVPFCLLGGTALAQGIGERLTPLPGMPRIPVVLIKPEGGISTAWAYGALDALCPAPHADVDAVVRCLNHPKQLAGRMENVFEAVVLPKLPVIDGCKQRLLELGADGALMSGTGSAVFGLFSADDTAETACRTLLAEGRQAFLTHTVQPAGRIMDEI